MAITFDKSLNVIEVTGVVVSIQDLINAIRDWEDSAEGITVASVANAYGKQGLTENTSVGITLELINNWRIQFEAQSEWTICYVEGGNIVAINDYGNDPIKPSAFINVVIAQSSSATISGGNWSDAEKTSLINNMELIRQLNSGKWHIINNQMIFYEDDNQTEIMRFNLFDSSGNPSVLSVAERVRV